MDKPCTDLSNALLKRKSFLFPGITHFAGQIFQLWHKDRFILKITCYSEENFTLSVQRPFFVITYFFRKKIVLRLGKDYLKVGQIFLYFWKNQLKFGKLRYEFCAVETFWNMWLLERFLLKQFKKHLNKLLYLLKLEKRELTFFVVTYIKTVMINECGTKFLSCSTSKKFWRDVIPQFYFDASGNRRQASLENLSKIQPKLKYKNNS